MFLAKNCLTHLKLCSWHLENKFFFQPNNTFNVKVMQMLCFKNVLFQFTENSSVKINHPWSILSFLSLSLDRSVPSKSLNNQGKKKLQGSHFKDCQLYSQTLLINGNIYGRFLSVSKAGKAFHCFLSPCLSLAKNTCDHSAGPRELKSQKRNRFFYFQVTGMNK